MVGDVEFDVRDDVVEVVWEMDPMVREVEFNNHADDPDDVLLEECCWDDIVLATEADVRRKVEFNNHVDDLDNVLLEEFCWDETVLATEADVVELRDAFNVEVTRAEVAEDDANTEETVDARNEFDEAKPSYHLLSLAHNTSRAKPT